MTKHLEAYVKSAFLPFQTLSLASLFDVGNWSKGLKGILNVPAFLNLVVLGALFFGGPFEKLFTSVAPKELGLSATALLASAPILLLFATLHTRNAADLLVRLVAGKRLRGLRSGYAGRTLTSDRDPDCQAGALISFFMST